MQKFLLCPFQLGESCPDRPAHAETATLPVLPGDVIIMATDGLFDNLSDLEVAVRVKKLCAGAGGADLMAAAAPAATEGTEDTSTAPAEALQKWLDKVAHMLVEDAQLIGMSETGRTPFSKQAVRAGYVFEGGKLDDTAVVAAMVLARSPSPPPPAV